MTNNTQTSKEYFKSLKVVHIGIIIIKLIIIISFILINIFYKSHTIDTELSKLFIYIIPVFLGFGLFASSIDFNRKIAKIKTNQFLISKMTDYRSALFTRYAILEGTSMISIIAFSKSGNYIYIGICSILFLIIFINKPTKEKAVIDLELTSEEEKTIYNPDSIISSIN